MYCEEIETKSNAQNVSIPQKETNTAAQLLSTKQRNNKSFKSPTSQTTPRTSQSTSLNSQTSSHLRNNSPPSPSQNCISQLKNHDFNKFALNCLYTNAWSLNLLKLAELNVKAQESSAHLIFVTETWFSELSSINLANYTAHKRNRSK